jgi:hypothetical protein
MKPFFFPAFLRGLALLAPAAAALAHSHIDAGPDPANDSRLLLSGPGTETSVYVPPGEPFSNYSSGFPGGYYANELTFSSEDPGGSRPRIELLSVTGPADAEFAFWEVGTISPAWSRPTGWTTALGDQPSLGTYEDQTGYGHIHGRLFTTTRPGIYILEFRAIDDAGLRAPSPIKTLTLNVLPTPALSLEIVEGEARLSFQSRLNLTYDLQVSTDLVAWTTIEAHSLISGNGGQRSLVDPLAGRTRVFYRLVEYF